MVASVVFCEASEADPWSASSTLLTKGRLVEFAGCVVCNLLLWRLLILEADVGAVAVGTFGYGMGPKRGDGCVPASASSAVVVVVVEVTEAVEGTLTA